MIKNFGRGGFVYAYMLAIDHLMAQAWQDYEAGFGYSLPRYIELEVTITGSDG